MSSMLLPVLLAEMLASYCIAGIPFGLIFGKQKGVDVRQSGSGNIGTTNVTRQIGVGAGVLTMVCDILKGWVCTFFGSMIMTALVFNGDPSFVAPTGPFGWAIACVYLACICGHVFSPYLKFRGGKGIAVGFGAALGFSWPIALGLLVVWALCAVPSRYVSAGSLCAAVALPFLAFFIYYPTSFAFLAPFILVAIIVVWAHRENLERLRAGTEQPFTFKGAGAALEHQDERDVMAAQAGAPEKPAAPVEAPRTVQNDRTEEQVELADDEAQAEALAAQKKAQEHAVDVNDVEDALEAAAESADEHEEPGQAGSVFFGDEPKVASMIEQRTAAINGEGAQVRQEDAQIKSAEKKDEGKPEA